MTFDHLMVWSNLCFSCYSNTGRLLHCICKYAGERIVAHGPLVLKKWIPTFNFYVTRICDPLSFLSF